MQSELQNKRKNPLKGHIQEVLAGKRAVQNHEGIQPRQEAFHSESYRLRDYLSEVSFNNL